MLNKFQQNTISFHDDLYDLIIPKDNILRRFNNLVDFSFIFDELKDKYSQDNGRNAVSPIIMFKYLLLKVFYRLSDADLVERSAYDMSFKYFLGLHPEDKVIDSSSLTKFRKLRLKDENILDLLISKSVDIALNNGVITSKSLIIDSTHTRSRYNRKSAYEVLQEQAKLLRKSVYAVNEDKKKDFPAKVQDGKLDDVMCYCSKLLDVINADESLASYPAVKEKASLLREMVEDNAEHLKLSEDTGAMLGHKTADTSFFGYKTHIAMTDERIITAATVTSGEKSDGEQLKVLIEKSRAAGIETSDVIGDTAYSSKENIEYAKKGDFKLISKLNPMISQGRRKKDDEFEYNKDAGMYVCKAGHMAIHKCLMSRDNDKHHRSSSMIYYFDVEQCRHCPLREGCYKEGASIKTYSVRIGTDCHMEQKAFQETEEFKEKAKQRYKIEAKNSELKCHHGYNVASSKGIVGMEIQGATTIFVVNLKRILKLMDIKKSGKKEGSKVQKE